MNMDGIAVVKNHRVVSQEEWIGERRALLAKEKELTRLRDELNEQRRALPWERVDKSYAFLSESYASSYCSCQSSIQSWSRNRGGYAVTRIDDSDCR
jgi:predicted dithiol-disulfide oxidoreductase (DUF899 family)